MHEFRLDTQTQKYKVSDPTLDSTIITVELYIFGPVYLSTRLRQCPPLKRERSSGYKSQYSLRVENKRGDVRSKVFSQC